MNILTELCSCPTAPFVERDVIEYAREFVNARPNLALRSDEFGNLLIELPGTDRKGPRWVFAAHMDHPGFVAEKMLDARTLQAAFRGGVRAEYFKESAVRFFDDGREITGVVKEITVGKERGYPVKATVRVASPVGKGCPGMWDEGEGRTKGGKFHSRVCDDLAGAAAALAMLDQLAKRPPRSTVAVLLTRAEEEGFIGAIAASIQPRLLRKSDRLIAIECSAMQPYAPQGKGAIVRIGDRTSIFNSDLTYFIMRQAEALAKKDKSFRFQRALMPGGTCEATVYDVYGFTAASICVALGNYHNMDAAKKKIGPEFIDLSDWQNMVKLFLQLARAGHEYEPGFRLLRGRLEKRFSKWKKLLSAADVPHPAAAARLSPDPNSRDFGRLRRGNRGR
jgi:endoglucanase